MRSFLIVRKFSGLLLALWWLVSFISTYVPIPEETAGLPYVDKLTHIFIYAGLAFLLARWLHTRALPSHTIAIRVILVLLIYAVLDEAMQHFVGRTPDIRDGLADGVGNLLGLTIKTKFHR